MCDSGISIICSNGGNNEYENEMECEKKVKIQTTLIIKAITVNDKSYMIITQRIFYKS